jgi:hypothetical protein
MTSSVRRATNWATLALLTTSFAAAADESSQQWRQTLFIYGMGAAIDGTAQIGDVKVPVDASMSDVFSNLEFGAMGAYRLENDTWSFTTDVTYMGLGGSSRTQGGLVKGDVDVDQFTLMGTVGWRLSGHVEGLFSLAYFDLSTDLQVETTAPISGTVTTRNASTGASWIDPLVGLQYSTPLGDTWRLNLRGDVGGFGVGSDLSYQLLANVRWQANDTVGVVLGYRIIAFDYESGDGRNYERYDLTEQGPLLGVTVSF